ncbi:MAG: ABC transporter permease [Christensenellaceae bacterium]
MTTDTRSLKSNKFSEIISKAGVFFILIILIIIGTIVNPKFFTADNFMNIIQAGAFLGILCAGMAFVTFSGNMVDMSAPIIIAISGIVAVDTLSLGIVPALALGMTTAIIIGAINGFVVGKLKANPVIWTLSMNFMLDGLIRWLYSNKQIYPDTAAASNPQAAEAFVNISRTNVLGIPLAVVVMIVLIVIAQYILTKTKFGQQLKVIGSNPEVAKFSGINVPSNIIKAYIFTAIAAGIAGIFITSFGKVGAYYNGVGYDFQAATAIVLGGVTLAGGRGNFIGVLGGVFTVKMLSNILTFIGIGTFVQNIIIGAIFILIIFVNSKSLRKLGRDDV